MIEQTYLFASALDDDSIEKQMQGLAHVTEISE
jgi:hypothetical protein